MDVVSGQQNVECTKASRKKKERWSMKNRPRGWSIYDWILRWSGIYETENVWQVREYIVLIVTFDTCLLSLWSTKNRIIRDTHMFGRWIKIEIIEQVGSSVLHALCCFLRPSIQIAKTHALTTATTVITAHQHLQIHTGQLRSIFPPHTCGWAVSGWGFGCLFQR